MHPFSEHKTPSASGCDGQGLGKKHPWVLPGHFWGTQFDSAKTTLVPLTGKWHWFSTTGISSDLIPLGTTLSPPRSRMRTLQNACDGPSGCGTPTPRSHFILRAGGEWWERGCRAQQKVGAAREASDPVVLAPRPQCPPRLQGGGAGVGNQSRDSAARARPREAACGARVGPSRRPSRRQPSPPAPNAPGPPLMPAMAVTSLLPPGPQAAAAAAGRPETRGDGVQTTPGSARHSTSAAGSRSRGGAGVWGARRGGGGRADPSFRASAPARSLPFEASRRRRRPGSGVVETAGRCSVQCQGSSVLEPPSCFPQPPTSFGGEGSESDHCPLGGIWGILLLFKAQPVLSLPHLVIKEQ